MTPNRPLVSILVRSMDRPSLDRALDSAAMQTWSNLEIVVVAACGKRHRPLPDSWKGRRLRFVLPDRDHALTRPQAANACLDAASGEWLNFLDDDDEFLPDHVKSLLEAQRLDDARVLYASARIHDLDGKLVGYSGREGMHIQLYNQNRNQPVATLFHRSLVDEGARFDPTFPIYEDHDFFINCATRTPFQWVQVANCVWNGFSGDSGCGFGENSNDAERETYYVRLREKWRAAFDRWKSEPESLIYLGQQHLKAGDLKVALQSLEGALTAMPGNANALNLCGMANFHAGNVDRALQLLMQADRLYPGQPTLLANINLVRSHAATSDQAS